ncbi:MAG TPA: abortive infection family protein [Polyangiaceae bacterium]|jgi:hypothetical protein
MGDHSIKPRVPQCVRNCRSLSEFWGFIQPKFGTYQGRRDYLRDEFHPLLTMLEDGAISPGAKPTAAVTGLNWEEVQAVWQKALERKNSDPGGALTAARTLLESICKHILDEAGIPYPEKADLPKLYGLTANRLNLAPNQHTEETFRRILGGCHSVVEGLGSLRSKIGDAHAQGKKRVRPEPRHAELAVNLAGAMATFLVETWLKSKATQTT